MACSIDSKTKRAKLAARREPYWTRIRKGLHLGYRVLEDGEGTWNAKWTDEGGKRHYHPLGTILDTTAGPAFDVAAKQAQAWAEECERGVTPKGETVEDVCKLYVADRRVQVGDKNANDAEGRFKRLVYGTAFGRKTLAKLRRTDIEAWRDAQLPEDEDDDEVIRRAKDSTNRNLTAVKAALNYAHDRGLIGNDFAWRQVKPFEDVGRRRDRFLTAEQRTKLLGKCDEHLRGLCTGLLLTAARPGELAGATVADFDKKRGTLTLRHSKTGFRIVTLSTAAINFFSEQTRGRIGNAPLLPRPDGLPWDRFAWRDLFKPAARAARLPRDVVLYSLRHAAISEMLTGGVNSSVVARLAGTSTAMIDKHYGHLIHEGVRERLDAVRML